MPIIANAKKAQRQTKTRTQRNRVIRAEVRNIVKKASNQPEVTVLSKLFSTIDRAVKKNIIHKNKAARLKSRAAKQLANLGEGKEVVTKKPTVKTAARKTKKTAKKTAKK